MANGSCPAGPRTRTTAVCFAVMATTLGGWPPVTVCCAAAVPSAVIRTWAAARGADSTRVEVLPAPLRLSATTPCSSSGADAAVKAPGAPAGPPDTSMAAVTGTFEVSLIAEATPAIDGSATAAAEPPGRSIPLPPVGWYEPLAVPAVSLTCALPAPGTATYSSRLPAESGSPGMMRLLAGGWLAGSHAPGWRALLLSRIAATSRPTLVRTCSATTLDPCTSLARDCTSRPWAGTETPVSVLPSSGPLSVKMSTSASAGWLSAFIRYSCMLAAACCPGPTNQKSVPGLLQTAAGSPPDPVCSTSSARAIDPVARTITPPRDGPAGTLPPAAG